MQAFWLEPPYDASGALLLFKQKTIDDVLHSVIAKTIENGERIKASRGWTRELYGVLIELENPRARLSLTESRGKIFSCLGELFWYLSGSSSLEYIKHYLSLIHI